MRIVYIALGWVAGVVLVTNNGGEGLVWLGLAGLAMLALWLAWHDAPYRSAMLVLVAFTLGGLRSTSLATSSDIASFNNTGGLTISGIVIEPPDLRDDRVQMRVKTEQFIRGGQTFPTDGVVLVQAARTATIAFGDRIAATGDLITPAEFDTFSYADFLARRGVFSIMPNAAVEIESSGHGNPFFSALFDLRKRAGDAVAERLPDPEAALLSGILLGDESRISPGLSDAFGRVGASHVIAISGFNMVILSGVVMATLQRLRFRPRSRTLIGILIIAIYTIFVGANAAVVRAAVMSSLLAIGPLLKRKTYGPASLATVTILMSLQNPNVLADISFQLSLFATLGLMLFVDPFSNYFEAGLKRLLPVQTANTLGGFLCEPLVVTLAAQITTLPLIVLHFERLSLLSLPVNLLIIPVQPALLIVGALGTLFAVVPGVGQVLYWLDLVFLSWTIEVVRVVSRLSFAEVEVFVEPNLIVLFFAIVIGGATVQATQSDWVRRAGRLIRRQLVFGATIVSGFGIVVLLVMIAASRPDGNLHVWFLDMGHSNAVLIQTPQGAQMLVDGGRFPSRLLTALGDRLPFNDREIEALFITQPDSFDIAALNAVLARYDVGVAVANGQPNQSETYLQLRDLLAIHEGVVARAGYTLETDDGVRVEVLHPQTQPELGDSLDDNALVLRVDFGAVGFLLTGDLSPEGQTTLLEAGQWPLATVMQLPRHATARSLNDDFLEATQPQLVILQSDRANRRGDPDLDVLDMLAEIPLFRTDQDGSIHLWTDGTELWLDRED